MYLKDQNNHVLSFEEPMDEKFLALLQNGGYSQISEDEAKALLNPSLTLRELKEEKISELESVSHRFDNELVCAEMVIKSSLGYEINADLRSQNNIRGLLAVIGDSSVAFLDANNEPHAVSKADLETMLAECASNGQALYAQKWVTRAQIEAATSENELNEIEIKFEMKDFSK